MDRKEWLKWIWYGGCLMLGSWLGSRALGGWHWSNDAAAWVQAVGSIVAIAVAIYIGRDSDKRARALVRDERERQATIAANSVARRLTDIASEARVKSTKIAFILERATEPNGALPSYEELLRVFVLKTPTSDLHEAALLFGDIDGTNVRTVLDYVDRHNRRVDIFFDISTYEKLNDKRFSDFCTITQKRFVHMAQQADEARSVLAETYTDILDTRRAPEEEVI